MAVNARCIQRVLADIVTVSLKAVNNIKIDKQIGAYTGKVLLLHGNKDQAVPHGFSKRALKYYPEAQFHIIEGADHGFEGEQFEEAITAIHTFLKTTRNP